MSKKSDLLSSHIKNAPNFFWSEALWHPRWDCYIIPNDKIMYNIEKTAAKMQLIRNYFNRPIEVTSWLRIPAYNKLIGGAKKSAHMTGLACDFVVKGLTANEVRKALVPLLEIYDIRMEDLPNASWCHIDSMPVPTGGNRYFKP